MYLRVAVVPDARKEEVLEGKNDTLILRVKEPAEGNQANKKVRELVALKYLLPLSSVRIISGHHSRTKLLALDT